MARAPVAEAPGTSNVVKVPSGDRRKPCSTTPNAVKSPTICPALLMATATVSVAPGTSSVVMVPSGDRNKPCQFDTQVASPQRPPTTCPVSLMARLLMMLKGSGGANVVIAPSGDRRKPYGLRAASTNHPTICPVLLMAKTSAPTAPGTSTTVTVGVLARTTARGPGTRLSIISIYSVKFCRISASYERSHFLLLLSSRQQNVSPCDVDRPFEWQLLERPRPCQERWIRWSDDG